MSPPRNTVKKPARVLTEAQLVDRRAKAKQYRAAKKLRDAAKKLRDAAKAQYYRDWQAIDRAIWGLQNSDGVHNGYVAVCPLLLYRAVLSEMQSNSAHGCTLPRVFGLFSRDYNLISMIDHLVSVIKSRQTVFSTTVLQDLFQWYANENKTRAVYAPHYLK